MFLHELCVVLGRSQLQVLDDLTDIELEYWLEYYSLCGFSLRGSWEQHAQSMTAAINVHAAKGKGVKHEEFLPEVYK